MKQIIISSILAGEFPLSDKGHNWLLTNKGQEVHDDTINALNYIVRLSLELRPCLISNVIKRGCDRTMFKTLVNKGYLDIEQAAEYSTVKLGKVIIDAFEDNEYSDLIKGHLVGKFMAPSVVSQSSMEMKNGEGELVPSPIDRAGFRKVGSMPIIMDANLVNRYRSTIVEKAMEWENSCSNYLKINVSEDAVNAVLDTLVSGKRFSCGYVHLDQRGRGYWSENSGLLAIKTNKMLRAAIRTPFSVKLSQEGKDAVAAFVAELNGVSMHNSSWQERIAIGYLYWEFKTFPENVVENSFEKAWLEAIYEGDVNHWDIPVEVDATASMMQVYGALLGSEHLLRSTNVLYDGTLHDAWYVEGVARDTVKHTMTPMGYGRSKENALKNIGSIDDRLKMIEFLSRDGVKEFVEFKDTIVERCKPASKMHIRIWDDEWDITPNHFLDGNGCRKEVDKSASSHEEVYYFNGKNWMRGIQHHVKYMPDLERFRLYFPSLLVHNLDSQIANHVCQENDWVLPNHDAFIVHPNDAMNVRQSYINALYEVYENRTRILHEYGKSIGIRDLEKFSQSLPEGTEFSFTALK